MVAYSVELWYYINMFKKDWIVFSILATFTVFLLGFAAVYRQPDGTQVRWLLYVAAIAIVATVAYLIYLLYIMSKQKFARLLKRENFNTEKKYVWKENELHIDFTGKLIADNYLTTKPLFPFSDVVGYRFEAYRISGETHAEHVEVLNDDERFVSIVLNIKKPEREFEFLYIPMFEVKVSNCDIGETIESLSDELVKKYPDLQQLVDLQKDLDAILATNKQS